MTSEKDRKIRALKALRERSWRSEHRKLYTYFPDTGPLRRELYDKHQRFFALGAAHEPGHGCPKDCDGSPHRERAIIGANRIGKTSGGGYEIALHLTGRYPDWWPGRRFAHPVDWWCSGDTRATTRDTQQLKLLGPMHDLGCGLIPGEDIIHTRPMQGVNEAIELVQVRHRPTGGVSTLGFRSYDQGRKAFQGTDKHGVWLDEEPPDYGIYEECITRTMTCDGMIILTFTPLMGLTQLVLEFFPGGAPQAKGAA